MLQQLKLPNGPNSVTLTYDGLGLRVEGAVDVEQKGKLSFFLTLAMGVHGMLMLRYFLPSREPTHSIRLDFASYRQS